MPTSDPRGGTPVTGPTTALTAYTATQSVTAAPIASVDLGRLVVVLGLPGGEFEAIADGRLFDGPRMPQPNDYYVLAPDGTASVMPAAEFIATFG